jgi:hypothetical protein
MGVNCGMRASPEIVVGECAESEDGHGKLRVARVVAYAAVTA